MNPYKNKKSVFDIDTVDLDPEDLDFDIEVFDYDNEPEIERTAAFIAVDELIDRTTKIQRIEEDDSRPRKKSMFITLQKKEGKRK